MDDAVIVSAIRTPSGASGVSSRMCPPLSWGGGGARGARAGGIGREDVDEVILGCVLQPPGAESCRQVRLPPESRRRSSKCDQHALRLGLKAVAIGRR